MGEFGGVLSLKIGLRRGASRVSGRDSGEEGEFLVSKCRHDAALVSFSNLATHD